MKTNPKINEICSLTFELNFQSDYENNLNDYPDVASRLLAGWNIESVQIHNQPKSENMLITFILSFDGDFEIGRRWNTPLTPSPDHPQTH